MPRKSGTSAWMLVGGVVGLFVLSLYAPKAWQSIKVHPLEPMRGTRPIASAVESKPKRKPKVAEPVLVASVDTPSAPELAAPRQTPKSALPAAPAIDAERNVASSPPPVMADSPPPALGSPHDGPPVRLEKRIIETAPPVAAGIPGDNESDTQVAVIWPRPTTLIEQLQELTSSAPTSDWAGRTLAALAALTELPSHADPQAPSLLARLRKLSAEAAVTAAKIEPPEARVALKRAEYALARRVEVWEQVHAVAANSRPEAYQAIVDPQRMSRLLKKIEDSMRGRGGAESWRRYLQLDNAWKLTQSSGLSESQRRDLARSILTRLESPLLNDTQKQFFSRPEFTGLAAELRMWAYEPIDATRLLEEIERYEHNRRREPGNFVADAFQSLRWSPDADQVNLADRLETHYRNANLRIAVSEHLLNRLLPDPKPSVEPVAENIVGASVYGRSETETRLLVRLIPDRLRIRLGLEAHGVVASETTASKGPATFSNDSVARYSAKKMLTIDRRGMRVFRSEAEADSETYNRGVQTHYDGLPVFGRLAQTIAMQKQQEQMGVAKAELDSRVANKASERLDREVQKKLQEAEEQFQARVLDPLIKLKLQPTALGMETTAERLIVRYRLAGDQQLAAHTPRPQAPGDSWFSLQIHQTAVNNAIEQLHFDGRQMTVLTLMKEVAKALGQPAPKTPEDLPTEVTLKFAERDSVRVQCDAGKVLLVIRLAELNAGKGNRWKNFEVRAPLVPQANGLDAQLIREDSIELSGERLGLRDQVALRGIFSRVISKNRAIDLVPDKFRTDPRLRDLAVQQFVIDDGWISLALTPQRQAAKPMPKKSASRPTAKAN